MRDPTPFKAQFKLHLPHEVLCDRQAPFPLYPLDLLTDNLNINMACNTCVYHL